MPDSFYTVVDVVVVLGGIGLIGWWLARRSRWKDEPANVPFKALVSVFSLALLIALSHRVGFSFGGAFAVPFLALAVGVVLSIAWAPHVGEWLSRPFTSLFDGGSTSLQAQPLYSIAQAKRKRGRYHEAVFAIHEQLRKFPNDMNGQMLLAEIQVENLNDLPGAQVTVERFCGQRGHAPQSIAIALNTLADWQLKFGQDIDAARQTLEQIIERFPDTEQSQGAALRIAHLGTTANLLASRDPQKMRLNAGVANVGLLKESASLKAPTEEPAAEAARYLQHLETYPQDSEIREKLALLYAEHYQRLDLATDQIEQLLRQPNHPPKQQAHWLNLMASLHIQHGSDCDPARAALQRIIDSHPESALAALASQRLARLKLDLKGREQAQVVKLGNYEQNIGLKKSPPKETPP